MKKNPEKNISGALAFLIIIVLSVSVAWLSLNTARKIIDNASASPTFNNRGGDVLK